MKFDFIIGNPPYQIEQNGRMLPIYHSFMDEIYTIGDKCELITPARFLSNAGQTGSDWNQKMLNDPHFKVLLFESDSKKIFSGVDIKGGVAISYHDNAQEFEPIKTFVAYDPLRSVMNKVLNYSPFESLTNIICYSTRYILNSIYEDHPEYKAFVKSDGKHSQIDTNAFLKMPIFIKEKPDDLFEYVSLLGRVNNQREYWWVLKKYMTDSGNLFKYKVFVSQANGVGAFDALSSPIVGEPGIGSTQSFIGIGKFATYDEADACCKYICTKFSRALLGILKATQHNPPENWKYIPIQDFTSKSDIDWSQPLSVIDKQLYKKYSLDKTEIEFIETHVKEME